MQNYLYFGGNQDSMNIPPPSGVTDKEVYRRSTLTLGDVSTTVYIHESLTPEQALNRLV